ncbi:MAG: tRNA (guanosine(46)-N7)-methyltransferase TrmB [Pseudomonadota bacterium]
MRYERAVFHYPAQIKPIEEQRLILEVGPGRGDFLFHLAETNPQASIVGIEIKGKRIDKLIRSIERRKLTNVCLIQDDVRCALPRNFTAESVDEIHILFPDPWPKKRHAKHRSTNLNFLHECLRVLKKGSTITFVTDHLPYAEDVVELFSQIPSFETCYKERIVTQTPDAFPTFFAQKWLAQGREITYQKYRRIR